MKTCHKHIYFIILFSCLSLTIFGQELKLGLPLGHSKLESNYSQIDFSSDGKYIITTSKRKLFLWDVDSGKLLSVFFEQLGINTGCIVCFQVIRFSPDSKKIITITEDNQLEFWDVITGESLNSINLGKDDIYDIDFNELNNTLKICFRKENSKIWNLDNMQIIDSNADCSNNLPYGFRWSYNKKFKVFKNYNNLTKGVELINSSMNTVVKVFNDPESHFKRIIFGSVTFSPDENSILTSSYDGTIRLTDIKTGKLLKIFNGGKGKENKLKFNRKENKFVSLSESYAEIWDISSGKIIQTIKLHTSTKPVKNIFISKNNKDLFIGKKLYSNIYDFDTGKLKLNLSNDFKYTDFNDHNDILSKKDNYLYILDTKTNETDKIKVNDKKLYLRDAKFNPNKKTIITVSDDDETKILELASKKLLKKFKNTNKFGVYNIEFSKSGSKYLTWGYGSVNVRDARSNDLISTKTFEKVIYSANFSPKENSYITSSSDSSAKLWSLVSGELIYTLTGHKELVLDSKFSNNGTIIITTSRDNTAKLWDSETGLLLKTLNGHTDEAVQSFFTKEDDKVVTSSKDGSIIIWDIKAGKQLIKFYNFDDDPKKWVHIHPSGLFDASAEAMEMMYWTKGLEVIDFSQLKEKYYMPGLWEKVMKGEYLGNVDIKRDGIQLQPLVELGEVKNGFLLITLTKREGGYGAISVFLNDKEIIKDARPKNFDSNLKKQTINLDVSKFNHLTKNGENNFTVKVKNNTGDVQSRGTIVTSNVKKVSKKPSFYGLFVGINDYVGNIDLKYPVPDVNAMYNAVELGAYNLFGKDKTHLYKLTTDTKSKPRKGVIKQKMKEIAEKASPEDVLFIYLSGHGLTWSDTNNQADFYFLTEDARFANKGAYNDEDTREQTAISTNEWVEYIKEIAANKTVMVIDACGSGQAVDNLIASRDIESNQIKAIDRMNDRTGMFVISGSAADKVSYEASKYGQGLLTYTLLKAMSGIALKENRNIDVSTLFNYAKDQVPFLAEGIGGIQEPQVLFPKSGSFDIGILNSQDQSKIEIKEPKDVYVRSTLINAEELEDNLELSSLLDNHLNNSNNKTRGKDIIWVDAKKYANGCKISGSYAQESNLITVNFKIICKETQIKHQVSATTKEELIKLILEKL
tara:strand:- start:269 stop:3700 length:3432 start_codon:yes stop_codon:yes gene_type:complete